MQIGLPFGIAACAVLGISGWAEAQTPAQASPAAATDVFRQAGTPAPGASQTFPDQGMGVLFEASPLPLSAGDLIEIQVFATPELSGNFRVDQNGEISLPVGGKVTVSGLTPSQAAVLIQERLKAGQIMLDPHVRVFTVQYATQGVTVLGEVGRPGTYTLLGAHTLYEALSSAGGLTQNAGKTITIAHHDDPGHPVVIPLSSPNYSSVLEATPVTPGDSVVVSRAENFYVVGDVSRAGEFPLINGRPNTVLNALAICGGANRTAKMTKAAIVRTTATGVQTIPLDLNLIMKNAAPNPVLQASDVLVVPRSGTKVFLETFLPSVSQTAASAVISSLVVR